jgi:methyl-accepting chemotaxis protein
MDLNSAIAAHTQWKIKLRGAISGGEKVDAATLSKDNCCELGKWLHGEGRAKLGTLPSFAQALKAHAAFHLAAGKVAHHINAGAKDAASRELDGPAFSEASAAVGGAIIQLKKDAKL